MVGHRVIANAPGLRGSNIPKCAAISQRGAIHHHATLGPHATLHITTFPRTLHQNIPILSNQGNGPEQPGFVVVRDDASLHRAALVRNWSMIYDHQAHAAVHLSRRWRRPAVTLIDRGACQGLDASLQTDPLTSLVTSLRCCGPDPNRRQDASYFFHLVHSDKPIFVIFYDSLHSMWCLSLFMPKQNPISLRICVLWCICTEFILGSAVTEESVATGG